MSSPQRPHDDVSQDIPPGAGAHDEETRVRGPAGPHGKGRRPPIEGFEILEEIGRGGMGVVYKARQAGLKRVVAVKMIRAGEYASPRQLARFRFEAEAVARLQHPHIVQVFQVGESQGVPFLVLEYVEGGNLADHVGGRPQPEGDAARLVETLARAIHHAHRRGVIHRDLKPSNILLAADGTPRIGDFGLAKGIDDVDVTASRAEVVGTVGYMSPEQVWGAGRGDDVGPAADVYALGVILYELLTGRPPFQGGSHLDVLQQVWSREPDPPSVHRPGLARDLETVCLTCLAKEPAKRYDDAEALADDLRRFLDGEPIAARPVSRAERAWRWCRRNPLPAGLLAALAATLLGGFTLVTIKWLDARSARARAEIGESSARASATQARRAERAALEQKHEADAQRDKAERALASFLTVVADREYASGNVDRAVELLGWCRRDLRNWEWNYLRRACVGSLLTIPAHARKAESIVFSPDGRRLATAGEGGPDRPGEVTLWDAATGRKVRTFAGHAWAARAVAFRPDGRQIATAGGDDTVRVWDVETGAPVRTLPGFARSLAYRPDGRQLAVGGSRSVRVYDADDGRTVRVLEGHSGAVTAVAFSADGSRLASASAYTDDKGFDQEREPLAGEIKVWDVRTGREQVTIRDERTRSVGAIALSPDGTRVVMADGLPEILSARPGEVDFLEAASGREIRTLRGHTRRVFCVAMSRDGRQIVSAGDDRTLRLWDAATGREVRTLRGHSSAVVAVAFSPDGSRLASAEARTGTVKVWDASETPGVRVDPEGRHVVAFTAPGGAGPRLVAAGAGDTVRLRDPAGGAGGSVLRGHDAPIIAVACRPGGAQVASSSYDGTVRIWDCADGHQALLIRDDPEIVALAYSPDGARLATAAGGEVVVRDAANGGQFVRFRAHPGPVRGLAYAPDGARLATSGADGSVKVWDAATGALVASRDDLPTPAGLAFDPREGVLAVSTGAGGSVRVWDFRGIRQDVTLLRHDGWVGGVAFSGDGSRLASACDDGMVKVWDVALAQDLLTLRDPGGSGLRSVAFSPDGHRLAAAGPDRVVVWDASPP